MERFELPDGWEWMNLPSLVTELESGGRPKGGVKKIASGIPSIGGEHLASDGGFNFSTPRYVPESFASKMNKGWVKPFDILIVKDGATTGKTSFVDDKFPFQKAVLNEHVFRLRVSPEKVEQKYLFWFLYGYDGQKMIDSAFRGSAQGGINQAFVEAVQVPLPPIPEQHRIVKKIESLFAKARTARAALERAEPLLKKFRQAVLSAAFRGELTERDANDELASVLLERIRAERIKKWQADLRAKGKDAIKAKFVEAEPPNTRELGELPEGWEWVTVEQIAEVRLGRQRSPARAKGPNMRPYLRSANVTWDGLDLSDVKEMDFTLQEQETYRLKRGDIVLVEGSGSISEVGKPAIWNDEIENCCMQNTLIRVRTDAPLPEYLHLHFQYDALGARFRHATKGIGINHLGAQGLSEWVIALPPLAEQKRIVERVETLFAQAEQIERAVEIARRRAEKVEQAILARVFRGEL